MNSIKVDVVSSEAQIFAGQAEYVVIPGIEGEMGIYAQHIPIISKLNPGVVRIQLLDNPEQVILAISGGFAEVQPSQITILADIVERTEELDEARLLEQKRFAEERLQNLEAGLDADVAKAYASLDIAIAQLKALEFLRKQSKR